MRYYINVSFQILLSLLIVLINLLIFIQAIEYESNVKVKFSYPLSGSTLAKGTIYFNVFHPLQKLPEFLKSSEKPGGNEKLRYLIQLISNEGESLRSFVSPIFNINFEMEGSYFIDICVYDVNKQDCLKTTLSTVALDILPDPYEISQFHLDFYGKKEIWEKQHPSLKNTFDDTSLLPYTDDIATYMMMGQKNNKMKGPIRVVHISDLRHIDGYKLHVLRQLTGIPKNKVYQEIIDLTCDNLKPIPPDRPFKKLLEENNIPITELCLQIPRSERWKSMPDWVKDLETMANADTMDDVHPEVFVVLKDFIEMLKKFHVLIITNGAIEQDTYLAELARLIGLKATILDLGPKGPKLLPYSFRGVTAFVGQSSYVTEYTLVKNSKVRSFLLPPVVHEDIYSIEYARENCKTFHDPIRTSKTYLNGILSDHQGSSNKPGHLIRVTYIGRVSPQKGFGMFIWAIKYFVDHILSIKNKEHPLYNEKRNNVRFEIVGTGKILPKVKALVEELGLSKIVFFLGFIPNKDIPCLLRSTSIFVFPSLFPESFGMVNVEAMFMKLPIISFGVGGTPDFLIDGYNGDIVTDRSAKGLATAIDKLVLDETRRKVYGENGFKLAKKRFSQDLLLKRYIAMYELICAENGCYDDKNEIRNSRRDDEL